MEETRKLHSIRLSVLQIIDLYATFTTAFPIENAFSAVIICKDSALSTFPSELLQIPPFTNKFLFLSSRIPLHLLWKHPEALGGVGKATQNSSKPTLHLHVSTVSLDLCRCLGFLTTQMKWALGASDLTMAGNQQQRIRVQAAKKRIASGKISESQSHELTEGSCSASPL